MNDQQHNDIPDIDLDNRHQSPGGGGYEEPPRRGGLMRWVVILLIVLGVFYLYRWMMTSPEEAYLQTTLDAPAETSEVVGDLPIGEAEDTNNETIDALDEPFDPERAIELTQEREPSELVTLQNQLATMESQFTERFTSLEEKLAAVQTLDAQTDETTVTEDGRLDDIVKEMTELRDELSALKSLVGMVESLRNRVSTLENKHVAKKKRHVKRKKVKPAEVFPFKVVSIDIWNGEMYAGLMNRGDIGLYRVDEMILGWRVESIDYDRQVVVFRSKSGKRVSKKVQR